MESDPTPLLRSPAGGSRLWLCSQRQQQPRDWGGRCDGAGSRDGSGIIKARQLADMTAGARQRQCPICFLCLIHLLCPPRLEMDWAEVLLSPTERKK